jgi:serine protease inhibitor
VVTRERSRQPKISELQVTLVVYQKVRPWKGSTKYNILAQQQPKGHKIRAEVPKYNNTFDISMQHLIDMAIVQARKQLLHVALDQDKSEDQYIHHDKYRNTKRETART